MRLIILLLANLLLLTTGCDRIEPGRTATEPMVLHGLTTLTIVPARVPARRLLHGTVESIDRGVLTARIPGQIERILVYEGQQVPNDAPLLIISGETATAECRVAQANVEAAERQRAEAETRARLARQTFDRYEKLHANGAITPLEYDQAVAASSTAEERLAAARAGLEARRAQLRAARTMAEQAQLKTPFPGRIADILVDAGSTVLPGTPLVLIDRNGPWLVRVALPETLAEQVALGDRFDVEIPSLELTLSATLKKILPAADPGSRTVTVKLVLPEANTPDLKAGLFAKVLLPEQQDMVSILIPADAIVTRGQLTGVYVVEKNILRYRLVRTGLSVNDQIEILSGLSDGEIILTSGLDKARHGARLEPSL